MSADFAPLNENQPLSSNIVLGGTGSGTSARAVPGAAPPTMPVAAPQPQAVAPVQQPAITQPPAALREQMVANAVDFLTHPRVVNSDAAKKQAFLRSKGLTDEEITESMRRAGAAPAAVQAYPAAPQALAPAKQQMVLQPSVQPYRPTPYGAPPPPQQMVGYAPPQLVQNSPSIRALLLIGFVCAGVGTTIVYLIRKYVIRYFWPDKKAKQLELLKEQLETMSQKVAQQASEVHDALKVIKNFLTSHIESYEEKQKLDDIKDRQDLARVSELKREVESVKNLLPIGSSLSSRRDSANDLSEEYNDLKKNIRNLKQSVSANRPALVANSAVVPVGPSLTDSGSIPANGTPAAPTEGAGLLRSSSKKPLPAWMNQQPSIPAWQQQQQPAAPAATPATDAPAESVVTPAVTPVPEPAANNAVSRFGADDGRVVEAEGMTTPEPAEEAPSPGNSTNNSGLSFQELVQMVQSGQTPPNVRTDIDDKPENPTAPLEFDSEVVPAKPWQQPQPARNV